MKNISQYLPLLLCLIVFGLCLSCDENSDNADDDNIQADDDIDDDASDDDTVTDDDDSTNEPPCDANLRPIVFVHGILEDGDAFATQSMRFASNSYCLDRLYSYDWNALKGYDGESPRLDAFIDAIRDETDADRVDMIGHSVGAGLAQLYLANTAYAAKISHYAQIAALPCAEIPSGVSAINISSESDRVIGVCSLENTENVVIPEIDHLQTATSPEVFAELYRFFNDNQEPFTDEILPEDPIELSGRAVMFGINDPVANLAIQVFQTDPLTGARLQDEPDALFMTDENGYWGPFTAQTGAYYEFCCIDTYGYWPPLHYYREPFVRSNNKVYFRINPPPDSFLGFFFRLLPLDDSIASFSYINVNRAVIAGRDSLFVNGLDLAVPELADAAFTTLVVVFGDINNDGVSNETPAGSLLPSHWFVQFYDLIVGTQQLEPIVFELNGRMLVVPNWPAESQGLSIAVFE